MRTMVITAHGVERERTGRQGARSIAGGREERATRRAECT